MAPGLFEHPKWPRRVTRGWVHRTGLLAALAIIVCCAPASQAEASSAPCTVGGAQSAADCQSTNPQVTLDLDGYGPSSCTFSTDIHWGDGSPAQTVMYPGNDAIVGSYDALLVTTSHTYSAPGGYNITTTTSATGADGQPTCANSGWHDYDLLFTFEPASCGVVTDSVGQAPAIGTVVNLGQRISTGSDGRVVIVFPDNTTLTMSANTTIVCDEYVYNPSGNGGSGSDNSTWSLLRGYFVYVSDLIGKNSDQINIQNAAGGCCGIRGGVGVAAVEPGGMLLHVIEGSGFASVAGKPEFDVPAGEGVLTAGDTYKETLRLPPGAASLIPARDRPPSIAALKATGKAHQDPVLRFKLNEPARVKLYIRRGKRTVVSVARRAKKGTNLLKLSRVLPRGSYTVELVAADQGLTSIETAALRIR